MACNVHCFHSRSRFSLSHSPWKKNSVKVQKEWKRIDQKQDIPMCTGNIDTKTPLGKMKKRGKKVHNDTKEQICKEKKNKFVEKREDKWKTNKYNDK